MRGQERAGKDNRNQWGSISAMRWRPGTGEAPRHLWGWPCVRLLVTGNVETEVAITCSQVGLLMEGDINAPQNLQPKINPAHRECRD